MSTRLAEFTYEELQKEMKRKEKCELYPKRNIILIGPPGSGKGTQAELLSQEFCYCHFASGDIFRNEIGKGTPDGLKAKEIMAKGELLPNDLAYKLLNLQGYMEKPQCKYGVVFDGYPRTSQCVSDIHKVLDGNTHRVDAIIELQLDLEKLVDRIDGRRIHLSSGRSYHIKFNPPKKEGLDDITGEELVQRKDDTKETVVKRYNNFINQTVPIMNYYKMNYADKYKIVCADNKIGEVYEEIKSIIKKL